MATPRPSRRQMPLCTTLTERVQKGRGVGSFSNVSILRSGTRTSGIGIGIEIEIELPWERFDPDPDRDFDRDFDDHESSV